MIGGGIAGLAAARFLIRGGVHVTVLEGSPAIGGKLQVSEIAGMAVDEGAESMLARRPEGLDLVRGLGLGDSLVYPGTTSAAILSRGALRRMPTGQVMGVPADLRALAASEVLSLAGLARVPMDLVRGPTPRGSDVSVAAYIGARLGHEVVDRLVEPLLGGVYAGRAEELSFESTLPALAAAAQTHRSLIAAARTVRDAAPADAGPVFVPAAPAGRLLAGEVPAAARELARIDYASMAIVTLAYAPTAFPRLPKGSGYLVPAVEGRQVKAVTFSTVKWPHLTGPRGGMVVVRCSIGRFRDEQLLQRSDEELRAAAMAELAETCAVGELPIETRVTRWGGGLPQYNVGHADRVGRIRSAIAGQPGLAVAGAAYEGLGIPACIATARAAASRVMDQLRGRGESSHEESARSQPGHQVHDVVGLQGEESG